MHGLSKAVVHERFNFVEGIFWLLIAGAACLFLAKKGATKIPLCGSDALCSIWYFRFY